MNVWRISTDFTKIIVKHLHLLHRENETKLYVRKIFFSAQTKGALRLLSCIVGLGGRAPFDFDRIEKTQRAIRNELVIAADLLALLGFMLLLTAAVTQHRYWHVQLVAIVIFL